jgi:Glycoside hydrolase 131 catalytic N-terminal domain
VFADGCSTVQTFYSQNAAALTSVTGVLSNDLSGQGQFHFGALKKGTGEGLTDVTKQGFQESGINEGVIFGGIFEEDSTGACVSLSP